MAVWVIWLIVAVLLGVAEIFTLTAVLGLLGGAALITSGAAAIGLPLPLQLLMFALASTAGLLLIRPIARRQSLAPRLRLFGVAALVGRTAHVVQEVTGQAGTVRIGGEEWTARALDESEVIPAGATVVVYPRE
ncbi:NfeD family protein [Pseudonocardia sp. H11422]|uniref:NfeD family protein n=1 Tax=Pseudonocardia sp. H11422 TaxID=2835866 RepID=UPI001BDC2C9F|nr:NfeD family protein [Pseudonocardia sp. H11422]